MFCKGQLRKAVMFRHVLSRTGSHMCIARKTVTNSDRCKKHKLRHKAQVHVQICSSSVRSASRKTRKSHLLLVTFYRVKISSMFPFWRNCPIWVFHVNCILLPGSIMVVPFSATSESMHLRFLKRGQGVVACVFYKCCCCPTLNGSILPVTTVTRLSHVD